MYWDFMIYASIYRIIIVTAGTVCIILGYKLFSIVQVQNHNEGMDDSELKIKSKNNILSFRSSSPGLMFSVFGILLISLMVITGAPVLQKELIKEQAGEEVPVKETERVYLRNELTDPLKTILSNYKQDFYDAEKALHEMEKHILSLDE